MLLDTTKVVILTQTQLWIPITLRESRTKYSQLKNTQNTDVHMQTGLATKRQMKLLMHICRMLSSI